MSHFIFILASVFSEIDLIVAVGIITLEVLVASKPDVALISIDVDLFATDLSTILPAVTVSTVEVVTPSAVTVVFERSASVFALPGSTVTLSRYGLDGLAG